MKDFKITFHGLDRYSGVRTEKGVLTNVGEFSVSTREAFGKFVDMNKFKDALIAELAEDAKSFSQIRAHQIYHSCDTLSVIFRVTLITFDEPEGI